MAQTKNGSRVILLDEIRGFAILCMVVYHTMYQLKYGFNVNVPIFFESWFDIIRDIFAGAFIFISGAMCRFSRNNLKRGVQCFFLGMVITFITPFFSDSYIMFGILHFLGISMMIYGLFDGAFERIPAFVGIILCAVFAVLTWSVSEIHAALVNNFVVVRSYGYIGIKGLFEWHLPEKAYRVGVLFPFGIYDPLSFRSDDYFPLLPWFFVFLGGSYFGEWAKNGSLPRFFYESHIKWLAAVGRYTIWIYLLHIPLIMGICTLIFR